MAFVPVAALLQAEGALSPDDVLRWLPRACDALAKLAEAGVLSGLTVDSLRVSREPPEVEVTPVALDGDARAQVRAVAALAYELLKGLPPPAAPSPDAWVGVRPELARILAPTLLGQGAADVTALALQLRALGKGGTAHYVPPLVEPHDTHLSGSSGARPARDRSGEVLGAYELVRFLGEGGMGEVWLARHVRLGREVAIKLLKPEFAAHPDVVQRFFQEARVVNDIDHPHIVQILDFVEEPGRVYCVMELLEGRTLAELSATEGPLGLARTCDVLAQVCDALEAAHQRHVVHRDIKPENVFVTRGPDGGDFVKVLDFGIARRATEAGRTQAGMVLGTPQYMAPEQAAGRAVDARADLYAVGVTLFEVLSHQSVASVAPTPVTRTARGEAVPPALTQLIAACLELDPARRPASAAAAAQVLRACTATPLKLEVLAPAPARPGRATQWAVGVTAVAALALGVVALRSPPAPSMDAPPKEGAAQLPPATATPGDSARAQAPDEPRDAGAGAPQVRAARPDTPTDGAAHAGSGTPPRDNATRAPARTPPKKPATTKTPPAGVATEAQRATALKRRYEALVAKHGVQQLTTIERAAVQAALTQPDAATLADAETWLAEAEARLGK